MPRGYYGANPSQMQDMWGNPPGYNPYQQNFQPLMGLQQIIQQLLAASQAKKQGQQEAVEQERATADKETRMYWQDQANTRAQESHEKEMAEGPKLSAQEQAIKARSAYGMRKVQSGEWNVYEALDFRDTGKEPENEPERLRKLRNTLRTTAEVNKEFEVPKSTSGQQITPYQKRQLEKQQRDAITDSIDKKLADIKDMFDSAADLSA